MSWWETVRASDTEKYGVDYEFIRNVMNELMEYLSWSSDDEDEDEDENEDDMEEDKDGDEDKDDMEEDENKDGDEYKDDDTIN